MMDIMCSVYEKGERLREQIHVARDEIDVEGQCYYVSAEGNDANDGCGIYTPWRTVERANRAHLKPGDAVCMRRGDVFREQIIAQDGVIYAAYGKGEKPRLYGSEQNLADSEMWILWDSGHRIWKCRIPMLDAGTLVFDEGAAHARKLIPSYFNGRFVCRNCPEKDFDLAAEMTNDLDMFCHFEGKLTTVPTKGQSFPVPDMDGDCYGELYLRCDKGNPGEVFTSIESLPRKHLIVVGDRRDIRIDNLCLMYTGMHGIAAGGKCVRNLHVSHCEISWIGGCVQHYLGTDPNYPQGRRGTVTRFGNGIEIYGGCDGYEVEYCAISQVYDAGVTHQISCFGAPYMLEHIRYHHNLIERCAYSIEYFLDTTPNDRQSIMRDIEMDHNILRMCGYGWGQQRHNTDTSAHIKGWSYVNTAEQYRVHDNVFDRAAYRMLHIVAYKEKSLPEMQRNTYIQYEGYMLGQFGANKIEEPNTLLFDKHAANTILNKCGDKDSTVLLVLNSDRGDTVDDESY